MICAGCGHAGASESGLCGSCAATLMRQGLAYQPAGKTIDQKDVRGTEMAAEKTAMAARRGGKAWQGKIDEMEMLLAQRSRMIEEYAAETQMMAKRIAALIDCLVEDYGCSTAEINSLLEV